ncbi:MAG: helix-turn-helix domain-containing protein [Acidimicrobiia bacterium]|nr:helix-turn-helix domain-containing protein [Acidimicrobiia bacterium]
MTAASAPRPVVQSVDRACRLLGVLRTTPDDGLSALELARLTGIDRTAVHRLLQTLLANGVVEVRGSRYRLGPQTLVLGNAYLARLGIREVLPYALDLQELLGRDNPWTVSLSVPTGDEVMIVDRVWGSRTPLDMILDIGTSLPIDSSASGRAMLAHLPPDEVTDLLGSERAAGVVARLNQIRSADGLSLARNELRPGVSAIAAALLDESGRPKGALILAGLELDAQAVPDSPVAGHVLRTAQRISHHFAGNRSQSK